MGRASELPSDDGEAFRETEEVTEEAAAEDPQGAPRRQTGYKEVRLELGDAGSSYEASAALQGQSAAQVVGELQVDPVVRFRRPQTADVGDLAGEEPSRLDEDVSFAQRELRLRSFRG